MALLRKNPRAATDRARKAGDWMIAARQYEEIGLQQVPKDDSHHIEAVVTLAHAFIRRGWSSIAVDKLESVLTGQVVTSDNLDLWDPFATALEEIGELDRAEELLRNMMSMSYNYRDIDKRHKKLVAKIEEEKKRESSFDPTLVDHRSRDATAFDGNRYKLDELLGKGGMGDVYRAFDRLLSRSLAYKVLSNRLAEDPVARDLLLQEARAAAGLNHPNIITVCLQKDPAKRFQSAGEMLSFAQAAGLV